MAGRPDDPRAEQRTPDATRAAAWADDATSRPGAEVADAAAAPDAPDAPRSRTQRARDQAANLRRRADSTVKDLEARRPSNRWIDAAFSTFERDVTSGGGVLAAALAFRIFIFMVPFVFVVVTAFPFIGDVSGESPRKIADSFGIAGLVADAIKSADGLSVWNQLWVLLLGLFALVLASRSLVRVLRITHGLAWNARVAKLRRPTTAGAMLIGIVFVIVLFGAWINKLQDRFGPFGLIPMLLSACMFAALWTLVQYHLPRAEVVWTKLIPGSILVAAGVEVLHIVTVIWFTRYIESKSETYGAIGAALAILLWAYFLGRIVVSGAMLNAALYEQEHRDASRGAAAGPGTEPGPPRSPSAPPGP